MTTDRLLLRDGGELAYLVAGHDPSGTRTALLLRPLAGSMRQWGDFADALAERGRIIAFDARGSGASSRPRLPPTTRRMAGDARALIDHLAVGAVDVFGVSLGGMVATWLAIDAPAQVRRLVLASTPPHGTAIGVLHTLRGARRGLSLARCLLAGEHRAAGCMARRILSDAFRSKHPEEAARIEAAIAAEGISRSGVLAQLAAAATHDPRAHLGEITAPTLVLHGEIDPLITADSQRRLVTALRYGTHELLPGVGHALTLEAPALTADRVAEFFGW